MATESQDLEETIQQALEQPKDEPKDEREYTTIEKEAMEMGWKPEDEFEGDKDKWTPAREYVKYGKLQQANKELHAKIERIGRDFDHRTAELNKLHQAQMEIKIAELREQQRVAVSEADTDKYDQVQKQIDDLQVKPEIKDPLVAEWETNNAWINNPNDPKTYAANGIYNNYLATNPGATTAQALKFLDEKLAETFPDVNPRRNTAPTTETSEKPRQKRGITMNDLTQEERDLWRSAGVHLFNNDEKVFLKACEDARKGA